LSRYTHNKVLTYQLQFQVNTARAQIEIQNNQIILKTPEWWELHDWNEMKTAYQALPDEIKQKIKENDLAPKITA